MSLTTKAVVGALWSVGSRFASRVVGLVGTLVITRFLSPEVMGEVGVAVVTVLTGRFVSDLALGQYIVARSKGDRAAVYHAVFFAMLSTFISAGLLLLLAAPLGRMFNAPDMSQYVPGMTLAIGMAQVARLPEAIALRDLKFKLFSLSTAFGEFTYVGVSVGLAAAGWGGDAIVWGNIAQNALRLVWLSAGIDWREWLTRTPISKERTVEMFKFCLPIALANGAGHASKAWDKLIISRLFGPSTVGVYNLSRRLGEVPADNVGDAVADVLMPSFARMEPDRARVAVVRACGMVSMFVYPLAAGVAVVSPTLVPSMFTPEWYGIAPLLTILAAMSIVDPVGDAMSVYLKARNLPRAFMVQQIVYLAVMLASVGTFGKLYGVEGACVGVGIGILFRAAFSVWVGHRYDQVSMAGMIKGLIGPAAATGIMVIAVLGVRELVGPHVDSVRVMLAVEIATGALTYPVASLLLARKATREVLGLVRGSMRRGASDGDDDDDS